MQNQRSVSVNWSWISQAWKLYTDNVGVWLIMQIIYIALSMGLSILLSIVQVAVIFAIGDPSSGDFRPEQMNIVMAITYPFMLLVSIPFSAFILAGFFKTAIKQAMGGQISVGDLFSGGDRFWAVLRFILTMYLIMIVGYAVILIPASLLSTNAIINIGNIGTGSDASASAFASSFGPVLLGLFIIMILFIIVFSGMFYAIPGIIHSRWGVIEGIRNSYRLVGSKILIYALFLIVVGLLVMSGVFLCFIGLLITMPFYFTIPAVAYREVVGGETETMPLPPPPPDHWMNNQ